MITLEEIAQRIKEKKELDKFKSWIVKAIVSKDKKLGLKYYERFFKLKTKLSEPYDDFHYWKEKRTVDELIGYIDTFFPKEERFPDEAYIEEDNHKKPLKIEEYTPPKLNIPTRNGKGGKTTLHRQFKKILTFVKFTQKRRYKDCCTILSIPTTSAENELIWGSRANVSNAIKLMIDIKLIEVHDSTYRFNAFKDDENRSRTFKYYVEVEREFLEYCKNNNIEAYSPDDEEDEITVEEIKKYKEIKNLPNPKEVRFSSTLKLEKPDGISKSKFERYLRKCLYDNYPYFIEIIKDVKEMNKKFYLDYPEFLIRFRPTFTWGEKNKKGDLSNVVVGIGIRATNAFCNKEKEERKAIIKSYGFDLEKDITSSVPRLTLSMNKGQWIGGTEDLYKLISQELDPNIPCEKDSPRREAIKALHMSVYFDEGSKIDMGKNVWFNMTKHGAKKDDVDDEIEKLKEAMIKVEGGKTYGSEIFYIESWIYLKVLHTILFEKNQLVWLVYDCFYGKGYLSQKVFNTMISGTIYSFFNVFYEEWKVIRLGEKRNVEQMLLRAKYLQEMTDNLEDSKVNIRLGRRKN